MEVPGEACCARREAFRDLPVVLDVGGHLNELNV
jgi:hypothetical protein